MSAAPLTSRIPSDCECSPSAKSRSTATVPAACADPCLNQCNSFPFRPCGSSQIFTEARFATGRHCCGGGSCPFTGRAAFTACIKALPFSILSALDRRSVDSHVGVPLLEFACANVYPYPQLVLSGIEMRLNGEQESLAALA